MAAPMTVYNTIEDSGIHVTKLMDETLYAGGCSKYFYQLSFTDEVLCKIETHPTTIFSCVYQENPFRVSFHVYNIIQYKINHNKSMLQLKIVILFILHYYLCNVQLKVIKLHSFCPKTII